MLLVSASFGLLLTTNEPNVSAASIGSISVTGGNTRSFQNVNYLLDGDILVSGSGSKLTFKDSTLKLSQDVGIDGELGGGDDHIYTITVENGGTLEFENTLLTTQTGQISPYYKIDISVDGSGSVISFKDSSVEGPGEITLTNRAKLISDGSAFYELQDQSSLSYDIDGDGSTADDVDFNDDGPLFSFYSGSIGLIVDSELRDTLSFTTASRDGFTAGNVTVDGSGTNLTVINSFLDVDFESRMSTGSHNMLRVSNGGIAHLVGVSVNVSASTSASHPAFYVTGSSSKVVYYRWIGAYVLDGMGIPVNGEDVTIYRVEGSTNTRLGSSYLTDDMLAYMDRLSTNWNETHDNGWAFIPVITDVLTSDSMPNADSYPDFLVRITLDGEAVQASTSFANFPTLPDMGDNIDIFQKAMDGVSVSSKVMSLLGGPLEFKRYVKNPSSSTFFSGNSIDLAVMGRMSIRGTSSIIDGTFYPSFYAFDGHLVISSGGHLTINDTTVAFLTDGAPAYILIQNGGKLEMGNVTLMGMGNEALYVYVMGAGTPTLMMDEGAMDIDHLIARDGALVEVECSSFTGSLNMVGSGIDATVSAGSIDAEKVFAENCRLQLDGSPVLIDDIHLSGVSLYSYDTVYNVPLDIDNYAMLTNVTFSGSLPQGRTSWLKPVDSGVIARAWWVNALVQDSVANPLPGSTIKVQRVSGSVLTDVSAHGTDDEGKSSFPLVQEELRVSGRTFLGNYKLTASFRGYSSSPLTTLITGSDVDAVITIPGGPNLSPNGLSVEGTLIGGFPVKLIANVTNIGEFDAGGFLVRLDVNGLPIGEKEVMGLEAGKFQEVTFDWMTQEGEADFELVIDSMGQVRETVETDNTFSQMNIIGMGPDYTVIMEALDDIWAFDTQGEFEIYVSNVGEIDPEANEFYLNVTWMSGFSNGIVSEYIPFEYIEPGNFVRKIINWTPQITGPVTVTVEIFSKYDRTPINSYDTIVLNILELPDIKIVLNSFRIDAPVPVTINTTVKVMLTVENVGDLPTGDFMVRLYDTKKDIVNQIGDEALVPGLDPNELMDLAFTWNTRLPIGYHDVIVVMDPLNSVREQNETNNEAVFKVMVDTPPDLTFTENIGASPKVVTEGKNMTFWATVKNVGRTKAMNALIHFYIDSDTNVIETRTIHLSSGQEMNISFGWVAEDLGQHTLFIVADYWNTIAEPVETNNLRSLDFTVISKPDLYMEENDLRVESDGKIRIGDDVGITAAVRNSGETAAYNVFIRFYDGDPAFGGKIISWKDTQPSVSIPMIPAGGLQWVNVTWKPQAGGYHNIYVVLDLANAIDESDEANNKVYWPVYVQTLPDLVFTNLSMFQGDFEVESAGVGKTLIVNATLENKGDTDAPSFKVNFYNGDFDNDPDPDELGSDVIYLSGKLKGNSKMYIEMPWRVGYPKGIRTIIVKTELLEGTEQRTNNNMISKPIEIFDIDDVPELLPLNETLTIDSGYPGSPINYETNPVAYQGMNVSLDLSVSNMGGKAASNTTVIFLASNATHSWVEYRTSIMFIENNGTDFVSGFWNLRDLGVNTLRVIVDPDNDIREFDEGNNILVISLNVKEAPDLEVTLIRQGDEYNAETGQFDMTKGKEYKISFMVKNLGNHSLVGIPVEYSGPTDTPTRTIDLDPYQQLPVTFTVKPDIEAGQAAVYKCRVNDDESFFEVSYTNNEVSSVINVLEPEKPSQIWILFVILALVVLIAIAIGGYFVYKKMKLKDMAKCSNCGGLVEVEETICPHCGIEFSDELECECGEIIPVGATECPACGRPIAGDLVKPSEEMEGEEPPEGKPEEEELEEIEEELEAPEELEDVEEAPEEVIREQPSDEEELAECFECGALIPVSAPICPHCGAVFE
ncbi:MAG: CARDB domain-containing protein [Thermoplasmatota archaeon]